MAEPEQGPAKRAKPASWTAEEKLKLLREHIQRLPWPAWPLGTVPSDTELENVINHFIEASGENPRPRTGVERQLRNILAAGADEPVLTAATRLQELTAQVCAGLGPWREPTAEWSALQDRTLLAAHIAELPASWEGAGLADTRIEAVVARFNSVDRTHSADSVVRRLCALLTFSGVRPTVRLCNALLAAAGQEAARSAEATGAAAATTPSNVADVALAAARAASAAAFVVECAGLEEGGAMSTYPWYWAA